MFRFVVCIHLLPLILTGCATMVARSGFDVHSLNTRTEVNSKFGTPFETLRSDSGTTETYVTRRKLSDPTSGVAYGMELVMLFGLREPSNLAVEARELVRDSILGQSLRFDYDSDGNIIEYPSPHSPKLAPLFPRSTQKRNGG